jgi:gliding motility-associated-like protein
MRTLFVIPLFWCAFFTLHDYSTGLHAQQTTPLNDECAFAAPLPSSQEYCSGNGSFTNVGATADVPFTQGTNACISLKWSNGVWFSFVPREPAVLIRVLGLGNGGTLRSPKIILFQRCGQYLSCSPGKDVGIDELVFDDLNIGQTYYIMVESSIGGEGTFALCVDTFIPVRAPESDCNKAVVLCDKSPFVVNELEGNGIQKQELPQDICIGGEFASAWYKWTCDKPGSLTFTLTPNNNFPNQITDDIDFALFELPAGLNDCANKKLLRCEGAGANTDAFGNVLPLSQWASCNGPTGLKEGERDIAEPGGCIGTNNNFVSPINMEAGKSYVLIINNFSRSGLGFGITFGGSGTFLGPTADFEVNASKRFECDKTIEFLNKSASQTDPITTYTWNFGDRAVPGRANGSGPFSILYESFGNKTAAVTLETSRGCRVTKIVDFFVDPCCKDTSTLDVSALATDLRCFSIPEGKIIAAGKNGSPEYSYSLDNGPYRPNPLFGQLPSGSYLVRIRDIKGCTDSIQVLLSQPPPIIADAGPDQTIELGETTFMNGQFTSAKGATLLWTPTEDFPFNGRRDPEVFPKNTTTYTFLVTDDNGCTKEDQVTIRVNKSYRLEAPNIFSPDGSRYNDFFNVWTNKAVKYLEILEVYDRWGNLIYQGVDQKAPSGGTLQTDSQAAGWDGTFNGQQAVPGVYTWRASVRFIDDTIKQFAGDITLIK